MDNKYLSVSAINRYLKHKLDTDGNLFDVYLKGEISNLKMHSTGHIYFSIKDETSKINAIMFSSSAKKLNFKPVDGDKVLLHGRISVYEATGSYQIYVNEMNKDGIGNLYLAYEKLKQTLSKEGLFDASHKKEIPKYPSKVGVITASTGAAVRDIISTIKRRYPICEVLLFPALVQGQGAYKSIIKSIDMAENYDLDVLIIGRGGGSIEDLWAFNEEELARRLFACHIPTISAVGHEIDYTIADFVCDMRAPTPTGAAEMAVPNLPDLFQHLTNLKVRVNEAIHSKVNYQVLLLDSIKKSFVIKNPMLMFEPKKQQLDLLHEKLVSLLVSCVNDKKIKLELLKNSHIIKNPELLSQDYKQQLYILNEKLNANMKYKIELEKQRFTHLLSKIELLNPISIISKGYSLTYVNDKIVKSIGDVKENIKVRLSDGYIYAKVERKEELS